MVKVILIYVHDVQANDNPEPQPVLLLSGHENTLALLTEISSGIILLTTEATS